MTPVDIGISPNNGQGDPLRVAFSKLNDNDAELDSKISDNIQAIQNLDDKISDNADAIQNLDNTKADLNGDPTQQFSVRDATADDQATNLGQVRNEVFTLYGAHGYNAQYKTKWHEKTTTSTTLFEVEGASADNYTGVKVLKEGLYRLEIAQRGAGAGFGSPKNPYCKITINGTVINGTFGYATDEDILCRWTRTLRLSSDDIVRGGCESSDADMKWGDTMDIGSLTVTRIGI